MKLLLDENLSRRLVPFLQHDYPSTNQVVLMGMESASDKEIWHKARNQNRAATLKVLIDYKAQIVQALEHEGMASIDIVG